MEAYQMEKGRVEDSSFILSMVHLKEPKGIKEPMVDS